MSKDLRIEDCITIPKEWVPVIQQVLGYVIADLEVGEVYDEDERELVRKVEGITRGLTMRTKDVPLVALPRVPMIGDE